MKPKFCLLLVGVLLISLGCTSQPDTTVKEGPGGKASLSTAGDQYQAAIKDFKFVPERITIPKGSTVMWTNRDEASHTTTSVEGSPIDSGRISSGGSYSKRFDEAGTFEYECTIHPWMQKGTVIVE